VGFQAGGLITTSLLMDGDYPQVRRLFPEESPITAVVKTSDLINATKRVSLVAERNSSVRLAFSEGEVTLDAGQTDDAQASEALECMLDGEPIVVAFNPAFLLDGLNALGSEYVQLGFTQDTKPVEFVGLDKPGGTIASEFRYLLVPIRIAS
jgi:DNA polymerase-3 subunit beta